VHTIRAPIVYQAPMASPPSMSSPTPPARWRPTLTSSASLPTSADRVPPSTLPSTATSTTAVRQVGPLGGTSYDDDTTEEPPAGTGPPTQLGEATHAHEAAAPAGAGAGEMNDLIARLGKLLNRPGAADTTAPPPAKAVVSPPSLPAPALEWTEVRPMISAGVGVLSALCCVIALCASWRAKQKERQTKGIRLGKVRATPSDVSGSEASGRSMPYSIRRWQQSIKHLHGPHRTAHAPVQQADQWFECAAVDHAEWQRPADC